MSQSLPENDTGQILQFVNGHEEKADTVDPYTTKPYFIVLSQVNEYTLTVNLFY